MTWIWYAVGAVLFAIALLLSVALHELGHLTFAKLFGVRVTQYMVGFGRTIWSRRRGETEYGLKLLPAGGYIRMVGMVPPDKHGRQRITSTAMGPVGFFRQIVEDTRKNDREQVLPTDDGRQFYQLHPAKRIVIMFAGPFMNLLIAFGVFLIVLMGIGVSAPTTTVGSVSECVVSATDPASASGSDPCAGRPASPAAAAGLQPGDVLVAYDGVSVQDWDQVRELIRVTSDRTVPLEIVRDGRPLSLAVTPVPNQVATTDDDGTVVGTETVGFLGLSPVFDYEPQSFGAALGATGDYIGRAAEAVVNLPARIPPLWASIFSGEERGQDSPIGIVGAGRIGGEILAEGLPVKDTALLFLQLVAGFNMSLFLLNLLPLLPLDGGHILGAVIEWIRRGWARVRRKADPGPFDVAKLMPVAYVVALLFIGLFALTFVADVVNPVRLFG
ncbi:M50 family metallopeptidase [Nakamurella leprariae]|uniref:Site-2 protease family protein n=1 Tax=Nakamurella leprariae TaxID=2803911 RepID=A0A938Y4C1_9ACTN|nr:site-2 protease family protein [Nakamurella leprariae]MBM9465826.1 site-2 protease family protein [Nakamurella leprariae]